MTRLEKLTSALGAVTLGVIIGTVIGFVYLMVFAITRTPWVDDCMVTYAKQLNANTHTWAYVYDLGDGLTHVDVEELPLKVIGHAYWCVNVQPGRPLDSLANTAYCHAARLVN